MGEPTFGSSDGFDSDGFDQLGQQGPVIRDRRRLDPETGRVREAAHLDTSGSGPVDDEQYEPAGSSSPAFGAESETSALDGILADLDAAQSSAAERLADLQRLQAEFVNYRRRVDRDRDVARDQAVASVLESLLPVLDDIHLARQHGDLDGGPFSAIAEKLDGVLQRLGLVRYGEPGEPFDPAVHEALMRTEVDLAEGITTTTVVQVLQPGYRVADRVLRAARVAVADPH